MSDFYQDNRNGSARWAGEDETLLLRRARGPYHGVDEKGRILRNPFDASCILAGGSGSGKGTSGGLVYNLCTYEGPLCVVDVKGELAAMSQIATAHLRIKAHYINPANVLGLRSSMADPLRILHADAPDLVALTKMFGEILIPSSGSASAKFWEDSARQILEAVMLSDVEQNGFTGLMRLYRIMNSILGNPKEFVKFLGHMVESQYDHVRRIAGELIYKQDAVPKEFSGIVNEATRPLAFLDGPAFAGLDNPDFCLSVLTEENPCRVHIIVPVELLSIWSPYVRLVLGVIILYRQRAPKARRILIIGDEISQLGPAPFLLRALVFSRGGGIQLQLVYQSFSQLSAQFGSDGAQTALSSCPITQVFGIRNLETAERVSRMLGSQTLNVDVGLAQSDARRRMAFIARDLLDGGCPVEAGLNYAQHVRASVDQKKMARPLLTPDECLRLPDDRQIIFMNGTPVLAFRRPYWKHRELTGRFLPNPYHPADHVTVPGFFGSKRLRVITEALPDELEDYPQFDGTWSYIEGYRPKLENAK